MHSHRLDVLLVIIVLWEIWGWHSGFLYGGWVAPAPCEVLFGVADIFLSILQICAAAGATDVEFSSVPDWVTRAAIGDITDENLELAKNGVYYVLVDRQTKVEEDHYVYYSRIATKIINRSGLESEGKLEFSFDPQAEILRVHSVKIIRDGEIINKLDPSAFETFRREKDLANGVTDGRLTTYAQIPGVRVGDIVDYEISWRKTPKLWPGEYFRSFSVEWSVPIGEARQRITLPEGKNLSVKAIETNIVPQISTENGVTEYYWQ